jgi:hypothetical protein
MCSTCLPQPSRVSNIFVLVWFFVCFAYDCNYIVFFCTSVNWNWRFQRRATKNGYCDSSCFRRNDGAWEEVRKLIEESMTFEHESMQNLMLKFVWIIEFAARMLLWQFWTSHHTVKSLCLFHWTYSRCFRLIKATYLWNNTGFLLSSLL